MNDKRDDMVLELLKKIQRDMTLTREDVADIRSEISANNHNVDGWIIMRSMLAGHVHHIEERVESLEGADK